MKAKKNNPTTSGPSLSPTHKHKLQGTIASLKYLHKQLALQNSTPALLEILALAIQELDTISQSAEQN